MDYKKYILYGVLIGLFVLFFISVLYYDGDLNSSVYWLIYKISGALIIYILGLFHRIRKFKDQKVGNVLFILMCGFMLGNLGYREVEKYKTCECNARFGIEFNNYRRRMGVHILPSNWVEKYNNKYFISWEAKNNGYGHISKDLEVNAPCNLTFEEDEYQFKPINDKKRSLNIRRTYQFNKSIDSIVYSYSLGDSTIHLNNKQADSLFTAEKIKKDY